MPNIKIRTMHDNWSTLGIFLEDGADFLCPKLEPGQVVEVPDDHPVFSSSAHVHVEITKEPANRLYRYGTLQGAMAASMSEEDAAEAAGMIGTSLEMSAKIRQDNFEALQKAKADGTPIPPEPGVIATDDGLAAPRNDNAETIGFGEKEQAAPPPSGGRRRRGKT